MFRLLAIFLIAAIGLIIFLTTRSGSTGINSPIPKVFGQTKGAAVNTWFPHEKLRVSDGELILSAKSALAVDYESGEILLSHNYKSRLPVASTAKVMTALVALENLNPATELEVLEKAATAGENSMGLVAGEKLTVEELLYGLMLVSGNDAAVVLAEGVAGSEGNFVDMMNKKARDLGLSDTKFVNATGLDVDENNSYSTAYDMAVIARYTWENFSLFRKISSTVHQYIEATDKHKDFDLYNDTNLLTTYPGVRGIKPGFTWEAGLCLVTYAENEGKKILAVILGSDDRRGEMKEILDYAFGKYGIRVGHPALDL